MKDILKKNLISIICGVVILAALGVAFTVLTGQAEELRTALSERKQAHDQLAGILRNSRTLPTIKLDAESTPEKLPAKFPSQKIIDQGEAIIKQVQTASQEVVKTAVDMNKHTPLEPGSLPEPSPTAALRFREAYYRYFPPNVSPLRSQLATDLAAGMPPTPEEIRLAVEQKADEIRKKKLFFHNNQPANLPQVEAEIADMARKLPDEMRRKTASSSRVYINPTTFTPYQPILVAAGAPTDIDIYLAQLSLWLQQDVVAAVNDANKGSTSVKDSVVKQLVKVTALPNFVLPASGTPSNDADAALPKETQNSPTGRVSNGMYDVFHLTIEADVDAEKLPTFLRALGQNRFMTPLWVNVKNVDLALVQGAGQDYGTKPVVNVTVQTEALYLRAWNKALMPKKVKEKLGIPLEDPAAQPAQPTPETAAVQ